MRRSPAISRALLFAPISPSRMTCRSTSPETMLPARLAPSAKVRASTSWRTTSPLRSASKLGTAGSPFEAKIATTMGKPRISPSCKANPPRFRKKIFQRTESRTASWRSGEGVVLVLEGSSVFLAASGGSLSSSPAGSFYFSSVPGFSSSSKCEECLPHEACQSAPARCGSRWKIPSGFSARK